MFGLGCDQTLRSPAAIQLGLPLAGWGVVYYGTLAALLLLGRFVGQPFELAAAIAALALTAAAAILSIVLFGLMVSGQAAFCPLCAVVQGLNVALVPLLLKQTGRPFRELRSAIATGAAYLLGKEAANPREARWTLVAFLAVGLVAVALYQWVFLETMAHRGQATKPFQPEQVLADFQSGPAHEIPTSDGDPRLGPPAAPVRIVVFSDFQCPGCQRFAGEMRGLLERFPGKLQIAFKHFPLGPACNDAIKRNLHPQACEAAWAAEAARRQDKFWPYHDALFAANTASGPDTPQSLARQVDLDLDRFQSDLQQPATRAKIAADVALGVELGVDATPSIFVNGRRAHDHRPQSLEVIIEHELNRMAE